MKVADIITEKLQVLRPQLLELANVSARHHGHAGDDGSGESHFELLVVSPEFTGKSRLERHRMINTLLQDELKNRVHALAIKALSPEETSGN